MFLTLVAVFCQLSSGACAEEIITDQATFQQCSVHGEIDVVAWMERSPTYRTGWTLTRWKCVPPDYKKARGA